MKVIKLDLGRVFESGLTLKEWHEEGIAIYKQSEQLTWQLADWAAFGQMVVNEDGVLRRIRKDERPHGILKKFCDSHGVNYGTLKTYSWVASNVQMSNRFDELSFHHHMCVAQLDAKEQVRWLRQALKQNWSVAELRRQLRQASGELSTASDGPVFHFEEKAVLDLQHALRSKPGEYWCNEHNRTVWRERLRPLVDFYESTLS